MDLTIVPTDTDNFLPNGESRSWPGHAGKERCSVDSTALVGRLHPGSDIAVLVQAIGVERNNGGPSCSPHGHDDIIGISSIKIDVLVFKVIFMKKSVLDFGEDGNNGQVGPTSYGRT